MGDYKCDYCATEGYTIRIDPKTGSSETLCKTHVKAMNADKIDTAGIYVPVRLIELLRIKGGCGAIIATSVDGLVAELTKQDKNKKPVTTQ